MVLEQQEKFVERRWDNENIGIRRAELKETIRKTIEIIKREARFEFETNPSIDLCQRCPVNKMNGGDCDEMVINQVV